MKERERMVNPNADLTGRIRSGRLMAFLRRDLFTVELDDGIMIDVFQGR